MARQLDRDTVIEGPQWPESVRILSVDAYGDTLQIDAVGTRSGRFYPGVLISPEQRDRLTVVSAAGGGLDFSAAALDFHLAIEAERIRLAHEDDPFFAVNASSITPLPHQLDAVYRYMLQAPLVRFLLADDPGAGKTIMAGLLLKELRVRGMADRVLIVVPPLVARQWQDELTEKFAEEFTLIDRALLSAQVGRNPWTEFDRCITSLYWAARDDVLASLEDARWDLVIVDEAHKMAAYRHGKRVVKTRRTRIYRLGEALSVRTRHLLMLTATPHKGDPENFRLLLELLDRDLFADRAILEDAMQSRENPIMIRRLKEEMCRFDGSPLFPPRTVKTVPFTLSADEAALYDAVTDYVVHHFNRAMQDEQRNIGFAMTILQRRLASSTAAVRASLRRRLARLSDLLDRVRAQAGARIDRGDAEWPEDTATAEGNDRLDELAETDRWAVEDALVERLTNARSLDELAAEVAALDGLVRHADHIARRPDDSKFRQLLDAVIRDRGLLARGEKLLVFTEAKDTLDFLVAELRRLDFEVATIDGSMPIAERHDQQTYFRERASIMIATEAGGESINLQFCNQMVNYDIPWNPNRLEQRMGRIHRIGQQNEVFVFNLVATETREGAVLAALFDKMNRMREGLGSDRVFDLVGDLLDDHDLSLSDLIVDCIAHRRRLDDALARIDRAISPEHQQALIAAREEALAHRFVDLPRVRADAARSATRALLPIHVEQFFLGVLDRHGGRWQRRHDEAVRIERVPLEMRRVDDPAFQRRHGRVAARYSAVVFDKARVDDAGQRALIAPGHPAFEAALEAVDHALAAVPARGAVFVDADADAPYRLWVFRAEVADGTGQVLARRLLLLREGPDGEFSDAPALAFHDLCPTVPTDRAPPPLDDFDVRKRAALAACLTGRVPQLVDEVGAERVRELDIQRRYLTRSFRTIISRHGDRLLSLEDKAAEGQDMALALQQEQRALDDARRRQADRLRRIEQESQMVPRAPVFVGVAAVLPGDAPALGAAATDATMRVAAEQATEQGRTLRDVRHEGRGYDAESWAADRRDPRFALVRPVRDGRVWLKASEHAILTHLGAEAEVIAVDGGRVMRHNGDSLLATSAVVDVRRRVGLSIAREIP